MRTLTAFAILLLLVGGISLAEPPASRPAKNTARARVLFAPVQILNELPKSYYPPAGDSWDGLHIQKANKWAEENLIGAELTVSGKYSGADARDGHVGTEFFSTEKRGGASYFFEVGVDFSAKGVKKVENHKQGSDIRIKGNITQCVFIEGGGHNVRIHVAISDCDVLQ